MSYRKSEDGWYVTDYDFKVVPLPGFEEVDAKDFLRRCYVVEGDKCWYVDENLEVHSVPGMATDKVAGVFRSLLTSVDEV